MEEVIDGLWREVIERFHENERLFCDRTGCKVEPEGDRFGLSSYGQHFIVDPSSREVSAKTELADHLLTERSSHFVPAFLHYMARIEPISVTGELLKPSNIPGGIIFVQGTHVLPLDHLAQKYNDDSSGFLNRGASLGGMQVGYGDVACRLSVFPKLPLTVILGFGDDEFPPKGELYFDTSARAALPPDVLWGIADLTVNLFLENSAE